MNVAKVFSQQMCHLREHLDLGKKGLGIYLLEELVGYVIALIEVMTCGRVGVLGQHHGWFNRDTSTDGAVLAWLFGFADQDQTGRATG